MSYQPHLRKLRKAKRQNPTPVEDEVAKALYNLELHHKTLKECMPRFHINTAKEVEGSKKKALVVFYPLRFLMLVKNIQKQLTVELEKKFAGKQVSLIAQRKVTARPNDVYKLQKVQRSKNATAVFDNILDDLLLGTPVVARRWTCRTDGSKTQKVFLDTKDRKKVEARLPTIANVYRKMTHRNISFGFMWNSKLQQISNQ